ncbi:hypothetical protein D9M70_506690 [compost metagenome]
MAWQDSLRAMGNSNIGVFAMCLWKAQVRSGLCQPGSHLLRRSDWRSRLQNDQVPFFQNGCNGLASRLYIREIRIMIRLEWRGYGDKESVCRFWLRSSSQIMLSYRRMHQHVQIRLNNMNFTTIDCINGHRVDINTNDLFLARGKHSSCGQPDIAQANNGNCFKRHL